MPRPATAGRGWFTGVPRDTGDDVNQNRGWGMGCDAVSVGVMLKGIRVRVVIIAEAVLVVIL